jgi:hypothetical protein
MTSAAVTSAAAAVEPSAAPVGEPAAPVEPAAKARLAAVRKAVRDASVIEPAERAAANATLRSLEGGTACVRPGSAALESRAAMGHCAALGSRAAVGHCAALGSRAAVGHCAALGSRAMESFGAPGSRAAVES